MSNPDFSNARSALTGALNVAGPILVALQQAEQVFGVLQNAEKHSKALAMDVDSQKKELAALEDKIAATQKKAADVLAEVGIAEADADARIEAVVAAEKKAVSDAKKATAEKMTAGLAAADALIQEAMARASAAQEQADTKIAELRANEAELIASTTQLESKLDKLKAQAQKFAAALTGE